MAQTGQAAKSIKKKTDAMPKASTGKLLKDAAVNAAMFVGPGKFLKGAKIIEEGVAAARLARRARGGSATASRMQKASKSTDASRREATRRGENAAKEARVESAKIPRPTRTVKQDVVQKPIRKPLERIPSTKAVALEPKPNVGGGLRTTTGQGRKPLPAKDVTDIAKERTQRPNNSGRVRDVKKPSSKELSPSEKAADIASKKSPVAVTRKKPMSLAEIKKAKATARKAKFDRVLTPRPKPKPNRAPLKPIDKSRGSNRPVKPKLSDEAQILENAKSNPKNWDIADQRKPSTIERGRGNIEQPPSITKDPRPLRTEKRSVRVEARNKRRAEKRDRRADIAGAKRVDYKKPRVVKYTTGPKSAKPGTTKRMKIGDQTVSRTNDPRNAVSDAGNMRERLRAIDAKTIANRKRRAIGKGGNKVSPELKAKVNATLGSSNKAKKGKALQNTFNKPKFSRNVTTGRLRATRPIKPVKK